MPKYEYDVGANVSSFDRAMERMGATGNTAADRLRRSFDGVTPSIDRIGDRLGGLAAQFVGVAAVFEGVRRAIGISSEFEQLDIQLTAVTGSAENGKAAFDWIKDFAAKTPYDVAQTAQAFIMLRNAGLDPMDGTLRKIADTAAKYTTGSDGMMRAVEQLTQAYGKGKIQAEDMNVLAEAGIPTFTALAAATGMSEEKLHDLASRGQLGKDAVKALIDELGRMSDGQSAAKMNSLVGQWSNFGDNIGNALDTLRTKGNSLDVLKEVLGDLNGEFQRLRDSGALDEFAVKFGEVMGVAADVVRQLFGIVQEVFAEIGSIWSGIAEIVGASTGEQITFMDVLIGALKALQLLIAGFRAAVEIAWAGVKAAVVVSVSAMLDLFEACRRGVAGLSEWIDTRLRQAGIAFSTFGEVAQRALQLDFSGAQAAYRSGMAAIEGEVRASAGRMAQIDAVYSERLQAQAAVRAQALDGIADAAQRARDRLAGILEPSAAKAPASAGGDASSGSPRTPMTLDLNKSGKAAKSRMQEWDEVLAADKTAFELQENAAGTFHQFSVQAESDYWAKILARTDLSVAERLGAQRKWLSAESTLRRNAVAEEFAGIKAKEEQYKNNLDARLALAVSAQQRAATLYGADSKEYRDAAADVVAIERSKQEQIKRLAEDAQQAQEKSALDEVQFREQMAQLDAQAGISSLRDQLASAQQFENERYAIQRQGLQQRLELVSQGNDADVLAQQRLNEQLAELDAAHTQKSALIARQGQLSLGDGARDMVSSLQSTWGTGLAGLLQGTMSWRQGINGMWASVKSSFFATTAQMAAKWIATEALKTGATVAHTGFRLAVEAAGALKSIAITVATALKHIAVWAYQAAAAAYTAMVGIPYVGPFLAPAAAATALGLVIAYGASIASAEGGYDIPGGVNPITQLHEREMVLPARQADVIRQMADGGAGSGELAVKLHGVKMKGGFFMAHQDELVAAIKEAHRKGKGA